MNNFDDIFVNQKTGETANNKDFVPFNKEMGGAKAAGARRRICAHRPGRRGRGKGRRRISRLSGCAEPF